MKENIKVATIISYSTLILSNVISLVYTPFMLTTLGDKEYGVFSLVNTIISYLYLLDLGMGNAVIRYNSKYMAQKDNESLKRINGLFLIMYTVMGIIGFVVGVIIYFNIELIFAKSLTSVEINQLKVMLMISTINISVSFPLNVFNGIIVSNEKFVYIKVLNLIKSVLNPILMVSVLVLGYRSVAMVSVSTIFNILLGFLNVIYCFIVLKVKFVFNGFDIKVIKEILSFSIFVLLGSIAYKIYWSTDQVVLGMYVSSAAISIYSIGSQFNSYFTSFSNVISSMFLPKLTKLVVNEKNNDKIMDILIRVSRIQFFITMFILSGFILVGKQFIKLWAGDSYKLSYYIAIIIMVPQIFSIIQSLFATMLEAMNKHKVKSFIYLGVSIVNLVLTLVFVKRFGAIGCAMGTCIGMSINALLNNLYYKYKLNLSMGYYWKEIMKLVPSVLVSFIIGKLLSLYIDVSSYAMLVLFIVCFSSVYFISCWCLAFNDYEKGVLLGVFERFKVSKKVVQNG